MIKKSLLFTLTLFAAIQTFSSSFTTVPPINKSNRDNGKLLSDWITLHLKLVRNTRGLSQGALFRHFTYTSIGFYEAIVNSDKQFLSLAEQLQDLKGLPVPPAGNKECWAASANASIAALLRVFYSDPSNIKRIDSLENHNVHLLQKAGFAQDNIITASEYGKSVADVIVAWARQDGSTKSYPAYEIPKADGLWEPTPPGYSAPAAPYAFHNRTCVKNSTANTLPAAPISFSADPSSPFYAMVQEVYTVSKNLTDEQRALALFWDDFPDGRYYGAAGHWASIFKQVLQTKQMTLLQGAAAYVKMNIAMMDAFNACWKAKYTYNVLRPITYIQKHMGHSEWTSLIMTPSHPEYPAAHATMSMAAATALTEALGNNVSFTDHSYDDLGFKARTFKSFEEAGREAGMSRLYGGIHYRPSIDAGYLVGERTAKNVLKTVMLKKTNQP